MQAASPERTPAGCYMTFRDAADCRAGGSMIGDTVSNVLSLRRWLNTVALSKRSNKQ